MCFNDSEVVVEWKQWGGTFHAYQGVHTVQKVDCQVTSPMRKMCIAGVKKTLPSISCTVLRQFSHTHKAS